MHIGGMTKKKLTSKAFRFSDDELALLEVSKKRHGSYKAAIIASLKKDAGSNDLSKEEVLAWIMRNIKDD